MKRGPVSKLLFATMVLLAGCGSEHTVQGGYVCTQIDLARYNGVADGRLGAPCDEWYECPMAIEYSTCLESDVDRCLELLRTATSCDGFYEDVAYCAAACDPI